MRIFAAGLFGIFLSVCSVGQAKFKTPPLTGPVVDEVGLLSELHRSEIEQMIRNFNQRGMAQIQVFITSSLQDLPIEQASIEITDQWKLGSKEQDNGLLFLIAPNERKMRIEVGQGLEGVMPDAYAKRITEDIVAPYFKERQMSEGVYQGIKGIFAVLDGEDLQSIAKPKTVGHGRKVSLPFWVIIPFWILIIFFGRMGGGRRRFSNGNWIGRGGGFGGGGFGGGGGGWSGGGGGFSGGGSSSSW
jgi:uncharacterized protein